MHSPDNRGGFQLFLDTSKRAAGSALYQIQNGTLKLIGYTSNRSLLATVNYSITEVELLGLCINISQFKHFHAKVDFECILHQLSLTYIKTELVNARMKGLIEVLTADSLICIT